MNKQKLSLTIGAAAVLIAGSIRILPHVPNFAPIAALALFSGAAIKNKKLGFVLPLIAQLAGDIYFEMIKPGTGFYPDFIYTYICFAIIYGIGILISKKQNIVSVPLASVAGSVIFFIVTNYIYWLTFMKGLPLVESYIQALPFFWSTMLSDLLFSSILFAAYHLLSVRLSTAKAATNL